MGDILNASAAARKQALALQNVNYGGTLMTELFQFNADMEKLYSKMQKLVQMDDVADKEYKKYIHKCKKKLVWWKKAEAGNVQNCNPKMKTMANPRVHYPLNPFIACRWKGAAKGLINGLKPKKQKKKMEGTPGESQTSTEPKSV